MTDWQHQFPSTSVTRTYKGDQGLGSQYDADGTKLLYELKNQMTFNNLGQLKMTRLFTDGTVITCWSHFGYDHIDIDVTSRVGVSCTITLIDLPDAIPPMKNNGTITEDEVEGVDYIKTYYIADTANCQECDATPDSTICTTDELTEDETACTPFTNCNEISEHCQAEIIEFGNDSGGTYFIWKAYTEWPPTDADGLGTLAVQLFFKIAGQTNNVCESISANVTVDCCEKNDDAYKVVHPEPEWGDLDIEYTSLAMGCDETQQLTAKYGCQPLVWTLVSGGGTLTPATDNLTAVYQSPETNPNCIDNPVIKLADRCTSKELRLAVSCGDPLWISYIYVNHIECRSCGHSVTPFCDMKLVGGAWYYNCTGGLDSVAYEGSGDEFAPKPTSFNCDDSNVNPYLNCGSPNCSEFNTSCGDCVEYWLTWWFGYGSGWHDVRTQEMKDGACCPINPETGLPA